MSEQSSRGSGWDKVRLKVLDRDAWTCFYCGKHLEGNDATADHIIAKASGGTDTLDNLVAACRRCNGIKQDRTLVRLPWINTRWLDKL